MSLLQDHRDIRLIPDTSRASTATSHVYVGTPYWTITFDANSFTADTIDIQVNNSRWKDPTQPNAYVHHTIMASSNYSESSLTGTVDPQFEASWMTWGRVSASAFSGSGAYRYMRLVHKAHSVTALNTSFMAFVHPYRFNS